MLTECCPKLQESNRSAQTRKSSPGVAFALFAEAVLLKIIALLQSYFCFSNGGLAVDREFIASQYWLCEAFKTDESSRNP